MKFIKSFEEIGMDDLPLVGGKNASLGEMLTALSPEGIRIPLGYAITAAAYWYVIKKNNLLGSMKKILKDVADFSDLSLIEKGGKEIRILIENAKIPGDLQQEIKSAYEDLSQKYNERNIDVAIRSSATAEDLPTASFAGQQETFLNINGADNIIFYYRKCLASLFTDRAIIYRVAHGFDHFSVALSVGVQKMVRSDRASAGVAFSLDTETGFEKSILINSSYGLGESLVKGLVNPDEFTVFKTTLEQGYYPIIRKSLGDKRVKLIYTNNPEKPVKIIPVLESDQYKFSINDDEVIDIARFVNIIDKYYSDLKGSWQPMDVEWAKDGIDGHIYIVQARPETVHRKVEKELLIRYELAEKNEELLNKRLLLVGQSIGQRIVSGRACIVSDITESSLLKEGEILVAKMTNPDWVPAMKRAAGIITDQGGRTCHAAIVSRELGIPAVVGAKSATTAIKSGQEITLDCSKGSLGYVYNGSIPFEVTKTELKELPKLPTSIMVNIADPTRAFSISFLPVDGVGLARIEFIINNDIKIHPMALIHPEVIKENAIKEQINKYTAPYLNKKDFFIQKLSQGIGMIAAAFYPKPVIVRLSDFKTNEYCNLIGGAYFEQHEANPMLGFRGAFRYSHKQYKEAFKLECQAFEVVRTKMGLDNVLIMIPFVRTLSEAKSTIDQLAQYGLVRGKNGLELVMMCEVPSNVILINEFSKLFDGFSIGSNDLTQLILGVDRDSDILASIFDERDPAVKKFISMAIKGAHANNKYIGICGQAPSDYSEFADFLMKQHIDAISLNADAVLPFFMRFKTKMIK